MEAINTRPDEFTADPPVLFRNNQGEAKTASSSTNSFDLLLKGLFSHPRTNTSPEKRETPDASPDYSSPAPSSDRSESFERGTSLRRDERERSVSRDPSRERPETDDVRNRLDEPFEKKKPDRPEERGPVPLENEDEEQPDERPARVARKETRESDPAGENESGAKNASTGKTPRNGDTLKDTDNAADGETQGAANDPCVSATGRNVSPASPTIDESVRLDELMQSILTDSGLNESEIDPLVQRFREFLESLSAAGRLDRESTDVLSRWLRQTLEGEVSAASSADRVRSLLDYFDSPSPDASGTFPGGDFPVTGPFPQAPSPENAARLESGIDETAKAKDSPPAFPPPAPNAIYGKAIEPVNVQAPIPVGEASTPPPQALNAEIGTAAPSPGPAQANIAHSDAPPPVSPDTPAPPASQTSTDLSSRQDGAPPEPGSEQVVLGKTGFDTAPVRENATFDAFLQRAPRAENPVLEQILSHARLRVIRGNREMHFQLSPPELGRVRVTLNESDGVVSGKIQVDNEAVKEIVESNLTQLKNALGENIKLDKLEVEVRENPLEQRFPGPFGEKDDARDGRDRLPPDGASRAPETQDAFFRDSYALHVPLPRGVLLLNDGQLSIDLIG
jgi:flagellar hook-length control protein FliK